MDGKPGNFLYGMILILAGALSACGGGDSQVASGKQNASLTPILLAPGDTVWTRCAVEGQVCTLPGTGTMQVRYGLNGTYNTLTASGSIGCNNQVFGDPVAGVDKVCDYATVEAGTPAPAPAPAPTSGTWTKCADEGGVCTFAGTRQVRYGQNGTYYTRTATDTIGCNNDVFGDPAVGVYKMCEYDTSTSAPAPTAATWTKCADEGGVCTFAGTKQVRYGQNGSYYTRTATDTIGCNNDVFGDPAVGVYKMCEYAADGTTSPPASSPIAPVASGSMTMACVDGPTWQCSGRSLIRVDNGVGLTSSGVQVSGRSTSDMKTPNPDKTGAFGMTSTTGGLAELRLSKDSGGGATGAVALLISNMGLTWDGVTERPPIVETFTTTQGRVQLDPGGALVFGALPASSNLGFYDYASKGKGGTQANYANNRYFPRSEPSRCDPPSPSCPTTETTGLHYLNRIGDWRTGGNTPDMMDANRVHGDGDVHAGDNVPGSSPPWLPGGSGYGVPFPGSKGYRSFEGWNYRYSNLGAWVTQDTVNIGEWGALDEHNKNRRGFVAYGAVTDPAAVPAGGTATYSGYAYGWYAANANDDPVYITGSATATADFAARSVVVSIQNTRTMNGGTSVPLAFTVTTPMGAAGQNVANYLTGPVDTGTLKGGISGRYFGPVAGTGPAEVGGAFSLSNAGTGQTFIGGFVGRKP